MPPKKKPDAPSKKTEMKKKEKVIEVSHNEIEMTKMTFLTTDFTFAG